MGNRIVNIMRILVAVLLYVASSTVARADDEEIVANVPFDFIVGSTHLPAGKYMVKPASLDESVMTIESADGRQSVFALTIPVSPDTPPTHPELVFDKRDNRYVLAGLTEADGSEREILRRRADGGRGIAVAAETP
jgi:hypothetical protein